MCYTLYRGIDIRKEVIMGRNEKLPTIKQLEIYELIHPDFGDMTVEEAAKQLNISISAAYRRIKRLKERCPESFNFEDFIKKEEENINNVKNIYAGYKTKAAVKGLEFTISLEDMIEIIQLECFGCGWMPSMELEAVPGFIATNNKKRCAYNHKTGYKFPYHRLWRYDVTKGYTYINCVPMCSRCIIRRRDNARRV